jgi:PhzF family phenazine biosynthesis protein
LGLKGKNMVVEVHVVNAFTDGDSGGNPAGVVIDANTLSADQKRGIAAQVGLPETAFVSKSSVATLKLDFFTPTRQIAHCGHATVATFSLLRQLGILGEGRHTKETIEGNRDVVIDAGAAYMQQVAPSYLPITKKDENFTAILRSLNISATNLLDNNAPQVVNTGNSFLIIPLASEETLAALEPDYPDIERISEKFNLIGYYAFTRVTKRPDRTAGVRMFAPRYGINEEVGTGTAAGPLACYLYEVLGQRRPQMLIEQGWLMKPASPSVITVNLELSGGKVIGLMAGGKAVSVKVLEPPRFLRRLLRLRMEPS